jgi:hypothetical protein
LCNGNDAISKCLENPIQILIVNFSLDRQQVKRGKVNLESVHRNIDTLMPEELQDDTKRAVEVCKDAGNGIKDNCESSFLMLKCLYKENPKFYFP